MRQPDNPMEQRTRDVLIAIVEGALLQMRQRKGPYSKIAQTLEGALLSGAYDDLRAGIFAFKQFSKDCDQLTLDESRKEVQKENERERKLEAKRQEMIQKAQEQETEKIEKARKQEAKFKEIAERYRETEKARGPQDAFWDDRRLSDGLDFWRPDSLSAGKRRQLFAKAPRSKRRSKAKTSRPKWNKT